MSDKFVIAIEVPMDQVGPALRKLDAMPEVAAIHLRVGESFRLPPAAEKPKPADVKPPKAKPGSSVRSIIANALLKGALHKNVIKGMMTRNGLSPHSANSALTVMCSDRTVERVGTGTYRLTKIGQRKYINSTSPQSLHKDTKRRGLRPLILKKLAEDSLTHSALKDFIVSHDYSSNNMYNVVRLLLNEGVVHRDGDIYHITDEGRREVAPAQNSTEPVITEQHGDIG